jgi:hypothetical protein
MLAESKRREHGERAFSNPNEASQTTVIQNQKSGSREPQ